MKVNSNMIHLAEDSKEYKALEEIIKKIASENDIKDVTGVSIRLGSEEGMVQFKQAAWNFDKDDKDDKKDDKDDKKDDKDDNKKDDKKDD